MFSFPKYHVIEYLNNPMSGRFQKQPSLIAFNKLPFELKVEPTQEDRIRQQGAKNIITGKIKDGKREFFTGLIPLTQYCFMGDNCEYIKGQKKNSLLIFIFSEDSLRLTVYYFNHYFIHNRTERIKLCNNFINHDPTKREL